jgi:hypothetical protein
MAAKRAHGRPCDVVWGAGTTVLALEARGWSGHIDYSIGLKN